MEFKSAAIPRRVKVQHINGITNVLTNSVSRLQAVGLYCDFDLIDHQQEFSTPFEPLCPVEPVTHTPLEVNEAFITPDIERLTQAYITLHNSPTAQTGDDIKLSLENVPPADIPQLEENSKQSKQKYDDVTNYKIDDLVMIRNLDKKTNLDAKYVPNLKSCALDRFKTTGSLQSHW